MTLLRGLSDLQLGDNKVTLNHLAITSFLTQKNLSNQFTTEILAQKFNPTHILDPLKKEGSDAPQDSPFFSKALAGDAKFGAKKWSDWFGREP